MSLTLEQVRRVAHLARIEISQTNDLEAESILTRLNGIFTLIEAMQAVDTQGVEPMAHAQDLAQRLRNDEVSETDRHIAFQALAPDAEAGLYLVPKVIE